MWTNGSRTSIRWAFNVKEWKPSREEWIYASRCVQEEEKERIGKFVFTKDAKASMIGQLLMRKAASEPFGIPFEKICFRRTESGKPIIHDPTTRHQAINYDFNISHQGDLCVLAAEQEAQVGVDVMKIEYTGGKSVPDFFSIMTKQFTCSEWDYIMLPGLEIEQLRRFFRLWCLKESYVKALGIGITFSLKRLSFHCPTKELQKDVITLDTELYVDDQLECNWKFQETLLDRDHCVAVAIGNRKKFENCNKNEEQEHPTRFTFLSFEKLMKDAKPFLSADEQYWLIFSAKSEKPR